AGGGAGAQLVHLPPCSPPLAPAIFVTSSTAWRLLLSRRRHRGWFGPPQRCKDPRVTLVLVERDDPVAVVLLNRPEALNALSDELMDELVTRLGELDRDEGVRCIVLGGNERAFAAGGGIGGAPSPSPAGPCCQRRVASW